MLRLLTSLLPLLAAGRLIGDYVLTADNLVNVELSFDSYNDAIENKLDSSEMGIFGPLVLDYPAWTQYD